MNSWEITVLDKGHERKSFDCGEPRLNEFLRTHAGQDSRRDISRTYVALRENSNTVVGYYTIAAGSVAFTNLPDELARRLPKYPIPTVHLGRLAVDRNVQGKGLGSLLLVDALKRARNLADQLGICGLTVHAKTLEAVRFYRSFGFLPFTDDPFHLFLPMAVIRGL